MATVSGPSGQQNFAGQKGHIGYFASSKLNQRVDSSLSPGFLLLLGSYMHLGWSFWSLIHIWMSDIASYPSASDARFTVVMTVTAWFIGAINGCVISGYVLRNLPNALSNYVGAIILFVSGIFFVAGFMSLTAMNVGRLLAGCCNGMAYIEVLKKIGDNSPASYRGALTAKISMLAALGSLMGSFALIFGTLTRGINLDQMIGFATLGLALASAITTRFSKYDSVVQLIDEGREREAVDMLIKLRKEPHETWPIRNEFDEMKAMVNEANVEAHTRPKHIFSGGNQSVLNIVLELKFINLLASNYVLYFVSILLVANRITALLAVSIFPSIRILALLIPMMMADKNGRRHILLISVIGAGASLFAMGLLGIIASYGNVHISIVMWFVAIAACVLQAFVSIGLEPVQHIYAVEAFPLAKRTTSLIFVTCMEHLIHIIFIILFVLFSFIPQTYIISIFLYSIGIVFGGLWLFKRLPETRGLNLRQCQNEFNKSRVPVSYNVKPGISSIGITYAT